MPRQDLGLPWLIIGLVCGTNAAANPVVGLTAPVQLTTNGATQVHASVSGNVVVFTDFRNGNEDIYLFDLATSTETQVTTSSANQRLPDVSGSRIVYTDLAGGSRIRLYDIATGIHSDISPGSYDLWPRIDGDIVALQRNNTFSYSDIFVYDLATATEQPVATTPDDETLPSVSGRRIAYQRRVSPNAPGEIVVYDLDTHVYTVLGDSALDDRRSDIDGDLVAWVVQTAAGDTDIAVHDLTSGQTEVLTRPGDQDWPHVSGRYVSLDDEPASGVSDVLLYSVDSGEFRPVAATVGTEMINGFGDNRVTWMSNVAGNFDIWMATVSEARYDPASGLEFGSVDLGDSAAQIVTLSHTAATGLQVTTLALDAGGTPGFAVGIAGPITIAAGQTLDVPVTFAPLVAGAATATLRISTNLGALEVALTGTGTSTTPPPQQQIAQLLAFFDASVTAGTLAGSGNGQSAAGRRGALRNMIEAAGDLIQQGRVGDACRQLADALDRTDGDPQPPDFVAGAAGAELAQRIGTLRTSLGCPD